MKKLLKAIMKIVIGLVCFVLLVLGAVHFGERIWMSEFYSNSEKTFATPGSNDGAVQQGFDYVEKDKVFLVASYMTDTTASSRVYVVDEEGKSFYTELLYADGSNYNDHTGGIECDGEYVYITYTSEKYPSGLAVFSYADILSDKSAKMLGLINTYNDPAHCYIQGGYMYAGSFYIAENYETPAHERIETPSGDKNTSLITVFKMDESSEFGVNPTPVAVISTPDCVQGMCFTDDNKIVLSTSYGLSASHLLVYDLDKVVPQTGYTFAGTTNKGEEFSFENLSISYLDSASLVDTIQAPPMAEELVYLDGKIYIMNESACNKYIFGKFTSGYHVYAYKYAESK